MFYKITILFLLIYPFNAGGHANRKVIPKLILISFDGFRWDYLNLCKKKNYSTPNFDYFISSGVSINNDGLKNVFVTKTFPNHYSIVTGLYEENHGIVANNFYDPSFKEKFGMASYETKWWDGKSGKGAEPIWLANQRCGCAPTNLCECSRKSGVVFWPGSEAKDMNPSYFLHYNESISFIERVDLLMSWFTQKKDPINFGVLYFHEPDSIGHKFGPNSDQVLLKIVELDKLLEYLLIQLEKNDMLTSTNIIITSDHGMSQQEKTILLDDYLNSSFYDAYSSSPVVHIWPKEGKEKDVFESLSKVPDLIIYTKEKIPEEYHYQKNRRIPPILITSLEGFRICFNIKDDWCVKINGDHGFNNSLKSMHPIFMGKGPSFKKGFSFVSFETVDLNPLMRHLLHIPLSSISDGKFHRVEGLLEKSELNLSEDLIFLSVMLLILVMGFIFALSALYHHVQYFYDSILTKNILSKNFKDSREGKKRLLFLEEEDIV